MSKRSPGAPYFRTFEEATLENPELLRLSDREFRILVYIGWGPTSAPQGLFTGSASILADYCGCTKAEAIQAVESLKSGGWVVGNLAERQLHAPVAVQTQKSADTLKGYLRKARSRNDSEARSALCPDLAHDLSGRMPILSR